jgi:hypothetical protein
MKNILRYLVLTLILITITACGGGGGGGNDTAGQNPPVAKTTATLKISQTGSLPATKTISGTDCTITLPVNVTPALTNGEVATGVVTLTGTFANSTLAPQIVYTAAVGSTPGTLRVILSSSEVAGLSLVGEIATITLKLANGASPTTSNFVVSGDSVIDATLYAPIAGMNVVVSNVVLQ